MKTLNKNSCKTLFKTLSSSLLALSATAAQADLMHIHYEATVRDVYTGASEIKVGYELFKSNPYKVGDVVSGTLTVDTQYPAQFAPFQPPTGRPLNTAVDIRDCEMITYQDKESADGGNPRFVTGGIGDTPGSRSQDYLKIVNCPESGRDSFEVQNWTGTGSGTNSKVMRDSTDMSVYLGLGGLDLISNLSLNQNFTTQNFSWSSNDSSASTGSLILRYQDYAIMGGTPNYRNPIIYGTVDLNLTSVTVETITGESFENPEDCELNP